MSLLSTSSDGQQVFLSPPILASASDSSGIIFTTENPNVNKTIVLQDGDHGVSGTSSKVQYTIIEDPSGSGGGYLQEIASSGQQGKTDLFKV